MRSDGRRMMRSSVMKMLLRSDGRVRRGHLDLLDLGFLKTLRLGSAVLEPNLDLSFGER